MHRPSKPHLHSETHGLQENHSPRRAYLGILCQQVDVVLIDLLHLLELATVQLPLGEVFVVDFGAQLPG